MSITRNSYIQILRGISISAVVLTHCLGKDSMGAILIKPWLYFQVMLFVFLSGWLTTKEKVVGRETLFIRKRLSKIIPPYIIWTVIYLLYDGSFTLKYFIKCLLTAGACGPLYFLVDYGQLVVLTPLFFRMLEHHTSRLAIYAITPVYIFINYWIRMGGELPSFLCACG